MSTPSYLSTVIQDYKGYSYTEIQESLDRIYKYLRNLSNISELDLHIAEYARNHIKSLSQDNQKSVDFIKKILTENSKKNTSTESNIIKRIYGLFNEPPPVIQVYSLAQEYSLAIDSDWTIVNEDSSSTLIQDILEWKPSNLNHTYKCPSQTEEDKAKIIKDLEDIANDCIIIDANKHVHIDANLQYEQTIIDTQKKLIASLGHALYEDYLKPILMALQGKISESLDDPTLLIKYPRTSSQEPFGDNSLLKKAVCRQAKKNIEGMQDTIKEVITIHEDRQLFPQLILKFLPDKLLKKLNQEQKTLLEFFIKSYIPEILDGVLKILSGMIDNPQHQEKLSVFFEMVLQDSKANSKADYKEYLFYFVENNLACLIDSSLKTLIEKLNDKQLNKSMEGLLRNALLQFFFGGSSALDPQVKKVLLSILRKIHEFLSLYNSLCKTHSQKSISEIAELIQQQLSSSGKLSVSFEAKDADLIDLNLHCLIEDILNYLLIGLSNENSDLIYKNILISVLAKCIQKICCSIFNVSTFHLLIEKIWLDGISIENPFEYRADSPPDVLFKADDQTFSESMDTCIKGIASEILKMAIKNQAVEWIGLKLVNQIPKTGDLIQRKLKQAFHSPTPLVPIILIAQLFFKISPPEDSMKTNLELQTLLTKQTRFFLALDGDRTPSLKKYFNEGVQDSENRIQTLEKLLTSKSTELKQKIASIAPFGTQGFLVDVISEVYKLSRNERILKTLLYFILSGLKEGLV